MATHFAQELTAPEFARFVTAQTIAILPVAAIEPHGPHLPLSTDCDIARGHLGRLGDYLDASHDVLVLPLQTVGHSLEHSGLPGVFSHGAELLLGAWSDMVTPFHAAGGRKLVIVSSHGGNSEIAALMTTRLRAALGMLAVTTAWLRFGQPEGLFDAEELAHGIHGGDIETSLMLHYRPDAVRRGEIADFAAASAVWDRQTQWLKVHGKSRPGWLSRDLNPLGVMGDATIATAAKGAASAHHALTGFAGLIGEVAQFDINRLEGPA